MKTMLTALAAIVVATSAASAGEHKSYSGYVYAKPVSAKAYYTAPPAYVALKLQRKNGI